MTELNQIYRCNICGNIVEMTHAGAGELVCCNQSMQLMKENTEDAATEKHVPIIEKTDNEVVVKVGEVPHPMEQEHYIEWIEILADGKSYKKYLNPGDEPQAKFELKTESVIARAYCNLHGLWKSK